MSEHKNQRMADSGLKSVEAERLQREHYDRIGHAYEQHYGDPCSLLYRDKFMCAPMFAGVELAGTKVLDAMCGSGQLTPYLLGQGASVTGLDISPEEIELFRKRWPTCEAVCSSVFDSGLEGESYDTIVVSGGLHHLHPSLNKAIAEFHRILKPGGHLCFAEPHAGSLPEFARKQWYKLDSLFADNEAGIDMKALRGEFSASFAFKSETYSGNLAYLLVLNSMVFRIPLSLKSYYSPALMALEPIINKVQGKLLSCFVVAQWQKK